MTAPIDVVHGQVIRTLKKTPRLAIERFILDVGPDPWANHVDSEETVVDRRSFAEQPVSEPFVVYSRRIAGADELDNAIEYFQGNYAVTVRETLKFVDASALEPLDESDFWPFIDEIGGKLWEQDINRAARLLSLETEEFILRFAQRMSFLTYELDHPANFDESPTSDGRPGVSSHNNQLIRGSVIGGGRDRFTRVAANPGSVDRRWGTDSAFSVLHLASTAISKKRRAQFLVETTWNVRTIGLNRTHWEEGEVEIDPPIVPERNEAREKWLAARDARLAALPASEREGILTVLARSESTIRYLAVRYLVRLESGIHEQLALFGAERSAYALDEENASLVAHAKARSLGGTVVGSVDFYDTHIGAIWSTQVFEIRRRSSLSESSYREKYVDL